MKKELLTVRISPYVKTLLKEICANEKRTQTIVLESMILERYTKMKEWKKSIGEKE